MFSCVDMFPFEMRWSTRCAIKQCSWLNLVYWVHLMAVTTLKHFFCVAASGQCIFVINGSKNRSSNGRVRNEKYRNLRLKPKPREGAYLFPTSWKWSQVSGFVSQESLRILAMALKTGFYDLFCQLYYLIFKIQSLILWLISVWHWIKILLKHFCL